MDPSNGYENIAAAFLKGRGIAVNGIGASSVRGWAKSIPAGSVVLDMGCGTGIPVSKVLIDEGMQVYGIDASPTMAEAFHQNFPDRPIACEAAESSSFFNRQFDGIISWGLLFLLPEASQIMLINKAAMAIKTGGKFLFTAPYIPCTWNDAMTEQLSISLGAEIYEKLIAAAGLSLMEGWVDEGENYYFSARKM